MAEDVNTYGNSTARERSGSASFIPDEIRRMSGGAVLGYGAFAGFGAALVTMAAAMAAQVLLGGDAAYPFRLAASIPLNTPPAAIDLTSAIVAGTLFHLVIASLLGILAVFVAELTHITDTVTGAIGIGVLVGFFAWLLNFYVAAPLLGAGWFVSQADPMLWMILHSVFFGGTLGLFIAHRYYR